MSAIPSPAVVAEPRSLTVPAPLARVGRALVLVAVAMLVPGEAARLAAEPSGPRR